MNVDGEEAATEISGKAGVGVDVTESLNIYGEVSFLTEDQSFTDDLKYWELKSESSGLSDSHIVCYNMGDQRSPFFISLDL